MNTGTGWPQGNNPKITVELGTLASLWEYAMQADHDKKLGSDCVIETDGPYEGYCKVCSVLQDTYEKLKSYGYNEPEWI